MNKSYQSLKRYALALLISLFSPAVFAATFYLPTNGDDIVGATQIAESQPGEVLWQVGRRYDIGAREILVANPQLPTNQQLPPSTKVVIPSRFILPPGPHQGIVVNLAELRLYYYPPNSNTVQTMPVGIGRDGGFDTPTGTTKVIEKIPNPSWHPPAAVRADAANQGYVLPDVWPPGPDNPLGQFAMRLGWPTYLIHGTSRPDGVGKRSSAGCIRMFPEDIDALFQQVTLGTPVTLMNEAFKVGKQGNEIFLEVHQPLMRNGQALSLDRLGIVKAVHDLTGESNAYIHWRNALQATRAMNGIPVEIAKITQTAAANEAAVVANRSQ